MIGAEGTRALAAVAPQCPSLLALKYGAAWPMLQDARAITGIHVLRNAVCCISVQALGHEEPKGSQGGGVDQGAAGGPEGGREGGGQVGRRYGMRAN